MRAFRIALVAVASCASPIASSNAVAECAPDLVLLEGACVSPHVADAYCGKGARFVAGRCAFRSCEAGQLLDLETGECATSRDVRAVAAAEGIDLAPGATLACDAGFGPALFGSHLACARADDLCPRGTRASRGVCVAASRCGAGEIADTDGACAPLFVAPRVVDVARWTRAVLGPDGGNGSRELCAPLALRAGALPRPLKIAIAMRFPANQIADATVVVTAPAASLVDAVVAPLAMSLRALGGESSAAAVDVAVTCAFDPPTKPRAVVESTHP